MTSQLASLPLKRIDGDDASLADYAGKVILVVNVASKCGLTPQYEGLQGLYAERRDQGLEVLGFPANDFNGQEPGTNDEIASFCSLTYDVTFPMFEKITVRGDERHPLYKALTEAQPTAIGEGPMRERLKGYGIQTSPMGEVLWNFEKFLIGKDGQVVARFSPDIAADDPRLVRAIDKALAA
jgi:glutathione peroxidase